MGCVVLAWPPRGPRGCRNSSRLDPDPSRLRSILAQAPACSCPTEKRRDCTRRRPSFCGSLCHKTRPGAACCSNGIGGSIAGGEKSQPSGLRAITANPSQHRDASETTGQAQRFVRHRCSSFAVLAVHRKGISYYVDGAAWKHPLRTELERSARAAEGRRRASALDGRGPFKIEALRRSHSRNQRHKDGCAESQY